MNKEEGNEAGSIIAIVFGHITVNVTVLDFVAPPSAVMRNIAVHVPTVVVAKVIVLPDDEIPVPDAT